MKRIIQSTMMACFAWICIGLASCSDDAIVEVSQSNETGQPFRLTVGQEAPSRLALGEDGLSVMWESGDKLYLVKKDRSIPPIELVTDLIQPAPNADFKSKGAVPAGEYHVVYNYNSDLVYGHHPFMSIDEINNQDNLALWGSLTIQEGDESANISLKHIYSKIRVELQGETGIRNYRIGMYASGQNGFPVNQKLTDEGFKNVYPANNKYIENENVNYHNILLGLHNIYNYTNPETGETDSNLNEVKMLSALILPADVSDGKLFFYAIDEDENICYEFHKNGVNFEPGKSYVVKINLSEASAVSELQTKRITTPNATESIVYMLKTAADCRHVAYYDGYGECSIEQDIDFTNEIFFPLNTYRIWGNGNKLSNINLDLPNDNNVGLLREEWYNGSAGYMECTYWNTLEYYNNKKYISDLTLENVTIKGHNYVGGLGGLNVLANRCTLNGSSLITASGDYVGGLVGYNKCYGDWDFNDLKKISNNIIESSCTIQGRNYVGGIIGSVVYGEATIEKAEVLVESCSSAATVSATGNYVGGIIGRIAGESSDGLNSVYLSGNDAALTLNECFNFGNVKGKDYVAGIVGDISLYGTMENKVDRVCIFYSANEGKIEGGNYVGGIAGRSHSSINTCYSINDIKSTGDYVGGIVGEHTSLSFGGIRIVNSYSLANISCGTAVKAGGIVGITRLSGAYGTAGFISNCYFAGSNTTGSGIVGYSEGGCKISNCLTTLASLGVNLGEIENEYDYDINGDDVVDENDVLKDVVINSFTDVTSILSKVGVLNSGGESVYSDKEGDLWENYPYYCVKFAKGISGSITVPGFGSTEIEIQ